MFYFCFWKQKTSTFSSEGWRKEVRDECPQRCFHFKKLSYLQPTSKLYFACAKIVRTVIILTCNFYNIFSASFLHEFVFAYIYTYRAMIFIVSRNNSKFHFISHREFQSQTLQLYHNFEQVNHFRAAALYLCKISNCRHNEMHL